MIKLKKNILTALILSTGFCFYIPMAAAAPRTANFGFDSFFQYSENNCQGTSLLKAAPKIGYVIDLSSIKDKFHGIPTFLSTSGMLLSAHPNFFMLGIEKTFAYMSEPAAVTIAGKPYTLKYISLTSHYKHNGYKSIARFDDDAGHICILRFKQL